MRKIETITGPTTNESRKLYLEKKLKTAKNSLKKYIKEDNKTWAMLEQRRVWDLEEQLNQLK
jgi:hypothetical protein